MGCPFQACPCCPSASDIQFSRSCCHHSPSRPTKSPNNPSGRAVVVREQAAVRCCALCCVLRGRVLACRLWGIPVRRRARPAGCPSFVRGALATSGRVVGLGQGSDANTAPQRNATPRKFSMQCVLLFDGRPARSRLACCPEVGAGGHLAEEGKKSGRQTAASAEQPRGSVC